MTRSRTRQTTLTTARSLAIAAAVVAALATAAAAGAQESDWRVADNPYQEEHAYSIGSTLSPGVEIDEVRWRSLRIAAAEDEFMNPGISVETEVFVEVENRNAKAARVLVIVLLEDEGGAPLERIELKTFKVGGERLKERTETADLSGDVLLAVRKIYVFCEVMR